MLLSLLLGVWNKQGEVPHDMYIGTDQLNILLPPGGETQVPRCEWLLQVIKNKLQQWKHAHLTQQRLVGGLFL